jgi:hypothetical protein
MERIARQSALGIFRRLPRFQEGLGCPGLLATLKACSSGIGKQTECDKVIADARNSPAMICWLIFGVATRPWVFQSVHD